MMIVVYDLKPQVFHPQGMYSGLYDIKFNSALLIFQQPKSQKWDFIIAAMHRDCIFGKWCMTRFIKYFIRRSFEICMKTDHVDHNA